MSNTQTTGKRRRKLTRLLPSRPSLDHLKSTGLWFPARNHRGVFQHSLAWPQRPQILKIERSSEAMGGWKRRSSYIYYKGPKWGWELDPVLYMRCFITLWPRAWSIVVIGILRPVYRSCDHRRTYILGRSLVSSAHLIDGQLLLLLFLRTGMQYFEFITALRDPLPQSSIESSLF